MCRYINWHFGKYMYLFVWTKNVNTVKTGSYIKGYYHKFRLIRFLIGS